MKRDLAGVLKKHGLSLPDGKLIDLQYNMGRNDWYALTDAGWLWWDSRERSWKPCPYGPL